jgi:hypothetical protein
MDISLVLARLGGEADLIQPLFITVDPRRDTPEVLRQYTRSFDPRIIGLSGDPQQIADAAQTFGAYYTPHKTGQFAEDYLIDHGSYTYLMDSPAALMPTRHPIAWPRRCASLCAMQRERALSATSTRGEPEGLPRSTRLHQPVTGAGLRPTTWLPQPRARS